MRYTVILFLFLIYSHSFAQSLNDSALSNISGNVFSEKDNQLSDVNVEISDENSNYTARTNSNGKYSIEIPAGIYDIKVSHPGYSDYLNKNYKLEAGAGKVLDIFLLEKTYSTDEIEVYGIFRQKQDDLRTSLYNIKPGNVKMLPGAVEDVLRTLQTLPGVTSPNDFTSQLVIRGSGPDQNLIVVDNVEVFNPYRLYGLVSMFNPETLSDISLITGGFPSRYGDRLSAVLDVTNREGDPNRDLSSVITASIANANLIFSGKNPFNIPGSWLVSSRRTYYDLIVGPFARNAGLITEDSSFPSFRDIQFKIALGNFNKSKFLINGIFSRDGVDIIPGAENENPDSVAVNDVSRNEMLSAAWQFNPGKNFQSNTTLSWYRNTGDNDFNSELLDPLIDDENYTPEQRDSLRQIGALLGLDFDSRYTFRKYSLSNYNIITQKNSTQEFGAGIDIVRTDLSYNLVVDDQLRSLFQSIPSASAFLNDFNLNGENNTRAFIFGQSMFRAGNDFFIQPSLRLDYFDIIKKPYIAPRINLGYAIDPLTTLRFATGIYYQSPGLEKLVDGRTFYDLKDADDKDLKAERAYHFILGYDRWITNEWFMKTEGYFKLFENLLEQQVLTGYRYEYTLNDPSNTDPEYVKSYANWTKSSEKLPYDSLTTNPVNIGSGNAYGFEISIEKKYISPKSKLYGWANYSLSFSDRNKYDITTPYRFDQRHTANLVLNYRFNNWLELGARGTYSTNFRYTPPVGITPRLIADSVAVNPLAQEIIFNLDFGTPSNEYSEIKPHYFRLDMRLTAYSNFWNADWAFYLDVINATNRKNVLGYNYYLDENLVINKTVVGMFPILPTIGVSVKF
ncbi:MAG TPA: TonB-dependent receptor [Ignavibacteria bacterium]|nr:TonB-dependent receptor [Ignavibacteria bacterium]